MTISRLRVAASSLFVASALGAVPAIGQSVITYHNGINRHGEYVVPGLTDATAASMHLDPAFNGSFTGAVYAQPLYWKATGSPGRLIVATEANQVVALNANTGKPAWTTQLPAPAPLSALQCGNISPEGITGTPVIDASSGTIYLDAVTGTTSATVRHKLYALSAETGAVLAGYPLDIQSALAARGVSFDSTDQGERSALLELNGSIYISYGGRAGDCGSYHGTVVQVTPSSKPSVAGVWATRAARGGIWSQGGAASDANFVYVTTGNTDSPATWQDGEAVLRLRSGLAHSAKAADYFAPSNWLNLDDADSDLGGTEAIPFAAPGGAGPRVIAFGKDGNAYLLNRGNLGGIGGALAISHVSNSQIITAPAVYNTSTAAMVVFRNGAGLNCGGSSLSMLDITSGATPIREAWCASLNGAGAPIITTTNGSANPLVWVVGAEGDNELHGFDALTGKAVFSGGAMSGLRHFQTLIAANNHLYVAGGGTLYAFTFTH
jgi:outer membrane protein assembly factor BamB